MEILRENYEFGGITYLVCSNGDIFGPTGKKLKARKNEDGYAVVTMGNKRIKRSTKFVHRIQRDHTRGPFRMKWQWKSLWKKEELILTLIW